MPKLNLKKAAIRNKFLNLRLNFKDDEIAIKSAMISLKLKNMDLFESAKRVLLYLPVKNEVETKYIINFLAELKKDLYIPAFTESAWVISKYKLGDILITGPFNIKQPKKIQRAHVNECDIAVVPGLVFSENGFRLGYGKGIYDRFLAGSSCIKIGLCYDFQIIKHLNPDAVDVPMDFVISEKRIINFT